MTNDIEDSHASAKDTHTSILRLVVYQETAIGRGINGLAVARREHKRCPEAMQASDVRNRMSNYVCVDAAMEVTPYRSKMPSPCGQVAYQGRQQPLGSQGEHVRLEEEKDGHVLYSQ